MEREEGEIFKKEEKVEEQAKNNNKNTTKKRKLIFIFILLCIVVIAGVAISQSQFWGKGKDKWKIKKVYRENNGMELTSSTRPKWEDMTITQKFFSIDYLDGYYTTKETEISSDKIGEKIETKTITKYNYSIEDYYSANVTFYKLIDFSIEGVIAVQFNDEPHYYVYMNSNYHAKTLGDLIEDFKLKDKISFGTITYKDIYTDEKGETKSQEVEFYNIDNSIIWEMLFNNSSAENVYNENGHTKANMNSRMTISVDIPLLGIKNKELILGEKGYLFASRIFMYKNGFDIGEEAVQGFMDYVINNYDGYKIVYIDKGNSKREEYNENIVEEKIMVTENTTNGLVTKEYNTSNSTTNSLEPYTRFEPYTP